MNSELKIIYKLRTTNYELRGFSLAETLIALGILAIGMVLIAGVFPVAIQLTTVSVERTTAAVVAEEAFAKVQMYGSGGIDSNELHHDQLTDFNDFDDAANPVFLPVGNPPARPDVGKYEFIYPSTGSSNSDISSKQYCWSALCRLTGDASANPPVQVTVFVCRKAGRAATYYEPGNGGSINWPNPNITGWPSPVKIGVSLVAGNNHQLRIQDATNEKNLINDDYTIVDDGSGRIYRVVKRLPAGLSTPLNSDEVIELDREWEGGHDAWVVPPAIRGGRNPCIAVYQKEILF